MLGHLEKLEKADLDGDSHGGVIETSMMLHLLGQHVGEHGELRRVTVNSKLTDAGEPPLSHENLAQLLRGFKHKLKYYETETYAGHPAQGDADLGRQIIDVLAAHTAEAFEEVYYGDASLQLEHSPTWKLRWLFTSPVVSWLFESLLGYDKSRVF